MKKRVIGIVLLVMVLLSGCSLFGGEKEDRQSEIWLKEMQQLMVEAEQMEVFESSFELGFDLAIQTEGLLPEARALLELISSYKIYLQTQVDQSTGEIVGYLDLYDGSESYPVLDIQVSGDKTYINIAKAIESLESMFGLSEIDPMIGMLLTMLFGDVEYLEIDNTFGGMMDYQAIVGDAGLSQEQEELQKLLEGVLIELASEIVGKEGNTYSIQMSEEHVIQIVEVIVDYLFENPDVLVEVTALNEEIYQLDGSEVQEMTQIAEAIKTDAEFRAQTQKEIEEIIEEMRNIFQGSMIRFEIEESGKGYKTFVDITLNMQNEGESSQIGLWFKEESQPIDNVELMDLSDKKIVNINSLFMW